MTNREKYIDKASNRDLAELLLDVGILGGRKCSYSKKLIDNIVDDIEDCKNIKKIEQWLSQEAEETADEMFEKLGYIIYETPTTILYNNINTGPEWQIIIDKVSLHFGKINKNNVPMLITEAEDKAIYKKIEEMKNEKDNN